MINPPPSAKGPQEGNKARLQPADPALRRPPTAGGPRRLPDPSATAPVPRPKKMSKALKGFLIGGGITGAGLGTSFLFF